MAGYLQLATLLARVPEYQMFRKFDKLTLLLLLYQQAELTRLEQQLEVYLELDDLADATLDIGKCWDKMSAVFKDGKASLLKHTILDIERKLVVYQKLLLGTARIHHLDKPSTYSHTLVNQWLSASQGGNNFLQSFEALPWRKERKEDLVSLSKETNSLDHWLARILTPTFHAFGRYRKPDIDAEVGIGELWEYKQSSFRILGNMCCMILSSVVPLASVFVLFFIENNNTTRLIVIAVSTAIFACMLGFITGCRRSEIFAGTAAFVAVQVVFLQSVVGIQQQD